MPDDRKTIITKGVEAALALAAETSWPDITLAEIADRAGLTLQDFHGIADKDTLTDAVESYFDKTMSEGSFDQDDTPRSRLFDVIMMRFEAMEPHRTALVSMMKWRQTQPLRVVALLAARQASAEWALTCAGLDGKGDFPKPIRATAVAWAIAQTERAWRKEDSADMSRTMARLDGELRKMEERAGWIKNFGRRRTTEDTSTDAQPEQAG